MNLLGLVWFLACGIKYTDSDISQNSKSCETVRFEGLVRLVWLGMLVDLVRLMMLERLERLFRVVSKKIFEKEEVLNLTAGIRTRLPAARVLRPHSLL